MMRERLLRDLAEIAVEASNAEAFRQNAVNRIMQATGADAGAFYTVNPLMRRFEGALRGPDMPISRLAHCVSELSQDEMHRALAPRTQEDAEVVSAQRRDSLTLYRELLPEFGIGRHAVRGFLDGAQACLITLARVGAHDRRRFIARTASIVDAAVPLLVLGERAHRRSSSRGPSTKAGLTASEAKVVDLLERGLTNREIALVLGLSPNTVRNRVASAFARVGASRRAELVYLLRCGNTKGPS